MNEHPNATLVRRGYEAFNSGDGATLVELIREDASFYQPGSSPVAGEHRGCDAVFAYFGQLTEASGGTFRAEPERLFASDRNAVVIHRATAQRNAATLDTRTALVFTIEDGLVTAFHAVQADQEAWDAFFGDV